MEKGLMQSQLRFPNDFGTLWDIKEQNRMEHVIPWKSRSVAKEISYFKCKRLLSNYIVQCIQFWYANTRMRPEILF